MFALRKSRLALAAFALLGVTATSLENATPRFLGQGGKSGRLDRLRRIRRR